MKKLLFTFLFLLGCSTAHAATTWYGCSGGGNWNGASVWTSIQVDQSGCIGGVGNPVSGDTAIAPPNSRHLLHRKTDNHPLLGVEFDFFRIR